MKNIYTAAQIASIVNASMGDTPRRRHTFITSVGEAVAREVLALRKEADYKVVVFAGANINGAYALECARALHIAGCPAEVYLINVEASGLGEDAAMARRRFVETATENYLYETVSLKLQMPEMDDNTIAVDGIFGRDTSMPLTGGYQVMARRINESGCTVVSIDIPSGMTDSLEVGMINRNIIHADITLTLVGPSLTFFMPENAELVGEWKILQAPYSRNAVLACECPAQQMDELSTRNWLPVRHDDMDKHDLGTALLFAGSYGMMGASVLAARGALRSGCGRVVSHGPRCAFYVMQTAVPCATFETDGADYDIQRFESSINADAVGVGPGIGRSDATVAALEIYLKTMKAARKPLVLDADALNCIARQPSMLNFIPPRSVLTPHAREFDRMFGKQPSSSSRLLKALEVCRRYRIIIVLKGHYTQTVWPNGNVIVNTSGTPALATGGTGDVLTGLMVGLIAQHMRPEMAAAVAVYIHGKAGQLAASKMGIRGTTAEDVANEIGPAIQNILNKS